MTDTIRELADVVFPAEAYPEKEGTLVHPDGRVQRLRPGDRPPARPTAASPAPACARCGRSSPTSRARSATSPATSAPARRSRAACSRPSRSTTGITLEEIGGRGVRWVERDAFVSPAWEPAKLDVPAGAPAPQRRQAAARHLPPAVGGQGGRPLAGAAVHPRPPGRRALAGRRRRARASARATGSRSATARACARTVQAARGGPGRQRVPRRGHARGQLERADRRPRRGPPRRRRARSSRSAIADPGRSPPSRAWPRCRRPPPLPIPPREVT